MQFRRKWSVIQLKGNRDRASHAPEYHIKLLLDGGREQLAGLLGGTGCGCGIGTALGGCRSGRRAGGRGGGGGLHFGLLVSGDSGARRHHAGFLAHLLGVTLQLHGSNRTISGGGDHLAQVLDAQIASRIHARHRGFKIVMRDHVTVIIELHHAAHQISGRHIAGKHEDTKRARIGGLPSFGLTGSQIKNRSLTQAALTGSDTLQFDLIAHVDLRVVFGLGGHCGVTSEVRFTHENSDFGGVLSQEHGFLGRSESAANHQHLLAGEELAVAGGAVSHATACVFGLALEAQLARAGAGGDEDAEGLDVATRSVHGFDVAVHVKAGGLGGKEFSTEVLCLLAHGLGERTTRGAANSRIVDDLVGDGDLPAEIVFFENQHTVASAGQVQTRGKARRSATNDYDVIKIIGLSHD